MTCCNNPLYSRVMGRHIPRTAADEMTDARKAIDAAFAEMVNWHAHLELMAAHPLEREAIGHQARRSARIVDALIAEATARTRSAGHLNTQLKSVS